MKSGPGNKRQEGEVFTNGLFPGRLSHNLSTDRGRGFNMSPEEIEDLIDGMMAPHQVGLNEEQQKEAQKRFDEAMIKYKKILLDDMKHVEKKYGKKLTQLHPSDASAQLGSMREFRFNQDANQMMKDGGKYFDYENNKEDREFRKLNNYYSNQTAQMQIYRFMETGKVPISTDYIMNDQPYYNGILQSEKDVNGPSLSPEENKKYLEDQKKREKKEPLLKGKLFGRYKA